MALLPDYQMILTDFQELNLPYREMLDGILQWCVSTKSDENCYLLNDGSHNVINLMQSTVGKLDFDTRAEAHLHAIKYYTSHGALYPYGAEYRQAINSENGSRVMTF